MEPTQLDTGRIANDARANEAAFARLATAIAPASVGSWKTRLSTSDVAEVERICRPWMECYGYA